MAKCENRPDAALGSRVQTAPSRLLSCGSARGRIGRAEAAPAGRLDAQPLAGCSVPVTLPGSGRPRAGRARARPAAPPARRAGRGARRSAISEKLISRRACSSRMTPSPPRCSARAARAAAQRVLDHAQRKFALERLDRRVHRVAHRHVHGARPVGVGAGSLAAARASRSRRSSRRRASGCSSFPGRARARRRRARGRPRARTSPRCPPRPPASARRRGCALRIEPSGAMISIGRKAPAEGGMSGSVSTRTANRQAERVTASGQLRLPSCWPALPVKSSVSRSPETTARRRRRRSPSRRLEHVLGLARAVGAARPGRRACDARRSRARRRSPGAAGRRRRALPARARRSAPTRLAASWARRSARRSAGWRIRATSCSIVASSIARGEITTPSSSSEWLSAGIDPGARPPTSA